MVDDVRRMPAGPRAGLGRVIAVRQESQIFRTTTRQEIQRRQHDDDEHGHREARGAPPEAFDQALHPRQDDDRAHAHTGERDADGKAAPAHKPVRQEERVPGVAEAHCAAGDEDAERQIEMPGRRHQRRQPEARADHHDSEQHDRARAALIDQPAEDRAEDPEPGSRTRRRRR